MGVGRSPDQVVAAGCDDAVGVEYLFERAHGIPKRITGTEHHRLSGLITRAIEHAALRADNEHLRPKSGRRPTDIPARTTRPDRLDSPQSLRHFARALNHIGDISAMMSRMVESIAAQRALQEKQDSMERAAFWNDLAARMSHENRNPLVAIKTFAQLLPER